MSCFAFVVFILALKGVVVVVSQAPKCNGVRCQYDSDCGINEQCLATRCGRPVCTVTLTCANVLCNINTVCRYVASCNKTTCTIGPSCIPIGEVRDGTDNECRRQSYTEVVLTQNPRNQSSYNNLTCSRYQLCPSGSDCVGGLCCRGKVPVPLTKSGLCPTNTKSSVCKGQSCSNDYSCPGEQKCCPRCRKVCADPIFVLNTGQCNDTRCQPGVVFNPCTNYVCQNGGRCTAPADKPYCLCPTGYTGERCETTTGVVFNPCSNYVCQNGGRCTAPADKPYCLCPMGYTGERCETTTVPLTCANVRCKINTVCREVASCTGATCTTQPRCIPIGDVKDDADYECRRQSYTEAVLTENPNNRTSYSNLACSKYSCPSGSDCVGGLCCRGQVPVPLTKPGLCPTDESSVCKGQSCINDYSCPGQKKCCSQCRKVCRDPIFVLNTDQCNNTRCQSGEVCVLRTPTCAPGMLCLQAFLPVCVPRQCQNCNFDEYCAPLARGGYYCSKREECSRCGRGEVCKFVPKFCLTTPCPQYACVPIDRCGGCTAGECKRNSCITDACGSYTCYTSTP